MNESWYLLEWLTSFVSPPPSLLCVFLFSLRPSLPPSLIPPSHSSTIFLSQPFYLTNILPPSLSATRCLHPFSVFSSFLCTLPYYPLSFTFFDHLLVPTFLPSPSIYLTGILPPSLSATRCLLLIHTPVTSVIMQKNGAGLHTASSCYWDNSTDGECVTTSRKKPVRHEQKHFTARLLPNPGNLMTILTLGSDLSISLQEAVPFAGRTKPCIALWLFSDWPYKPSSHNFQYYNILTLMIESHSVCCTYWVVCAHYNWVNHTSFYINVYYTSSAVLNCIVILVCWCVIMLQTSWFNIVFSGSLTLPTRVSYRGGQGHTAWDTHPLEIWKLIFNILQQIPCTLL